jgi:hypothetical protein
VLPDGRAPPRRADGSCAGGLGDPLPFPPRKKIAGLMLGLAVTHHGYPRVGAHPADRFLRWELGRHRLGFSEKGMAALSPVCSPKKNRAPVLRHGAQFGAEPPVGWWLALRDNGQDGRVFLTSRKPPNAKYLELGLA